MNLYDHYQTNETATSGEWIPWGTTGARFKLARASAHDNAKFKNAMERRLQKYRTEIRLDVLPADVDAAATREVFAETVILDWKGVKGPDDEDIPFSRDACVQLLTDLPELFAEIKNVAADRQTFQDATVETDAKN